jgi:hypothetical protein
MQPDEAVLLGDRKAPLTCIKVRLPFPGQIERLADRRW